MKDREPSGTGAAGNGLQTGPNTSQCNSTTRQSYTTPTQPGGATEHCCTTGRGASVVVDVYKYQVVSHEETFNEK